MIQAASLFEQFWSYYPSRNGRPKVGKSPCLLLFRELEEYEWARRALGVCPRVDHVTTPAGVEITVAPVRAYEAALPKWWKDWTIWKVWP